MKLEDQCCSLELSKKLKNLGVEQDSLFWWSCDEESRQWSIHYDPKIKFSEWYSAFTVAELGEMLPLRTCSGKNIDKGFYCYLDSDRGWTENDTGRDIFHADTEADARAKMMIYLIENGLAPTSPK